MTNHLALPGVIALLLAPSASAQDLGSDANKALGLAKSEVQSISVVGQPTTGIQAALRINDRWAQISMEAFSVRAAGFELIEHRADGTYAAVDAGPVVTMRGTLEGEPGATVAGALLEDGLYARIVLADERELWLQPLAKTLDTAGPDDYIVYEKKDILRSYTHCGADLIANNFGQSLPKAGADTGPAGAESDGNGLFITEIACDADYEFYLDHGASMASVSNRIQTVLGTMNAQYESELGITHEITTILVRSSSNQPYTSTNASTLLGQFRGEWNSNHTGIQRDITHLFTGKSINSGTIGIAYIGVICNASYGYGLVESDFNNNFASATDLSAHELGHNWNAPHCSCTSYTMNPFITTANTFNPNSTRGTITSFRDSRSCLEVSTGGNPPGAPTSPTPSQGATDVGLMANTSWGAGTSATSYDVFFGTDATPDAGEFQGNQASTTFDPGALAFSTTYFWRIDSVNGDGTTTGTVWSFTTAADPGSGGSTVIFEDSFDGSVKPQWMGGRRIRSSGSAAFSGSGGVRRKRTQLMYVSVSTANFTGLRLECARRTTGLDNGERLEISVNGDIVESVQNTNGWRTSDIDLGAYAGLSTVTVQFAVFANKNNERADIDEVRIIGTN